MRCQKDKRKLKRQSRMNNSETQATLGTRHRMKTTKPRNTPQKNKKMSNTNHTKKPEVNTGAEEG